jgi:hypothetical protein
MYMNVFRILIYSNQQKIKGIPENAIRENGARRIESRSKWFCWTAPAAIA